MKIKTITRILLMMAVFATASIPQQGCKKFGNVTDGLKLIIDYNLIKTTIDVQLIDATSGELIGQNGDVSVTVHVTGEDRDGIVDITGVQHPDYLYLSQNGFVGLALQPNETYTPSETNPVAFDLVINQSGYLATSQHIVIADEGHHFVVVKLVQLGAPPSGVVVRQQPDVTQSDGTGKVEIAATVVTEGNEASLVIPEGIIIRDAAGNPLVGNLDVTLVYFDNTDEEALKAFPGGMITRVTRTNNTQEDGMFYSAGFVAIEITDDNGNRAASFADGELTLTSRVQPETYNPETQTIVAAGDEIPLWSFDETSGEWTEEETLTIGQGTNGLELIAQLSHLSYFNFDWFYGGENCYTGSTFYFTLDQAVCDCYIMYGTMYRQVDGAYLKTIYMWVCGTDPVYTYYAPAGVPVYIVWEEGVYNNFTFDANSNPLYIENLCGQSPVYVNMFNPNPSSHITIEVEVYCASNPDYVIRPSFGAWFRPVNSWNWRWAEMVTGWADICNVNVGETYVVGIYYDNEWYETEVTVTQSDYSYVGFELPSDVCAEVFGL